MKTKKIKRVTLTMKQLEQVIAGALAPALDAKIKELGLDKIDRKFGQFPGHILGKTDKEIEKMEKKEKIGAFVKAVYMKDMMTIENMKLKTQTEGVGSEGGFSVPEEFAAEINRIAEDFGLIRRFARKIPMGSDTRNLPRLASSVFVTFPGETNPGTKSDFVEANVQLLAKTAVGLSVLSNELLADANVSMVDFVTELFGEALAGMEDLQGLTGSGAPFVGVLTDPDVNEVVIAGTTFASVDLDDLNDMTVAIKPLALANAAFTMHRSVWGVIQKLKDSDLGYHITVGGGPLLTPGAKAGKVGGVVVGTIWGYPVYLSEQMPPISVSAADTPFIIFGDYRHIWFGDRQQMSMSISDSATIAGENVFERNMSAVRITERLALAVGLPDAFVRLVTSP